MPSNEDDALSTERPKTAGKPNRRRQRRVYIKANPDDFDMEAAILLWEHLTGEVFTGDRTAGLPYGMTQDEADMSEDGEDS